MNGKLNADVSVVVPTFDDGAYLERCLASIVDQDLAPLEIVVIDDGSSAPAALAGIDRAIARFPQVRLVRQANAGPSAARNRGLSEASGRYIAFVDADDELASGSLSRRRALIAATPGAIAAYCGVAFVEPDGGRWNSAYRTGAAPLAVDTIGDRNGVPGFLWAYMIAADALAATGGLNERLRIMEDFDLLARLGRSGGIVVGDTTCGYVQHRRPGSLARGSALRQMAGALRFLAEARRQGYFSRRSLVRRYLRVPLAGAKVLLRYGLRRGR